MQFIYFIFGLWLYSTGAWAEPDCTGDYARLASEHHTKNLTITSSVCKAWPATKYVIVANSIQAPSGMDLELIIIDSVTKKIIDVNYQKGALSDAAIYTSWVKIDTANYKLDHESSAFGVRIKWKGSSGPNPYGAETIDLYRLDGGKLIKILNRLAVHEYSGEWDMRCNGDFSTRDMLLIMRPSAIKGGVSDILIKEKTKYTWSREVDGECQSFSKTPAQKTHLIKYKNGHYMTPAKLQALD